MSNFANRAHLLLMLLPYLIGITLLVAIPALLAAPVAFTDYDALSPPEFVGLDNFAEMRDDPQFWNGLKASLILLVLAVPLRLLGALSLALLLRARNKGFGLFRGVAFLPTIIPDVAYALVWLFIFNPLYGPLNWLSLVFQSGVENELMPAGATPGVWLTDPRAAQVAIIVMVLFTIGEGFILLLANLHEMPKELFDAAAIDGASGYQQLRYITLPLISPSLLLVSIRDTIFILEVSFVAAIVLTQGGPYYATSYLPFWIYLNATEFQRYGYAAAMTWVLYGITAIVIALQFLAARRWREMRYA